MRGVHPVRGPPGYCTDRKSLSIYGSRTDRVRCNRTARSSGTLREENPRKFGLRRNQQSDEISGIIPALPLGDARLSQHAAANGAHAMSKLEGAPCRYPAKPREGLRQPCGPH